MKPYYEEPDIKIYQGHILEVLKTLDSESVNTIITSPPYWGLRDYGEDTKTMWDGDPSCEHNWQSSQVEHNGLCYRGQNSVVGSERNPEIRKGKEHSGGDFCSKCGAWYGQLGLEPTLDLYINHLLQVTAELKRVLRKDGIMFWNQGDSYGGSWQNYGSREGGQKPKNTKSFERRGNPIKNYPPTAKLTSKCLALQNYRLILRMTDEQGWILRNSIIWNKPNHMPSSVKDRFANAYEPVFMLVKSKKYWFDLDVVRLPHKDIQDYERHSPFNYRVREAKKGHNGIIGVKSTQEEMLRYDKKGQTKIPKAQAKTFGSPRARYHRTDEHKEQGMHTFYGHSKRGEQFDNPKGKNPGDVWKIPTQPFPEAHFATFPENLVKPMIMAGCPQSVCKKCGKARERILEHRKYSIPKDSTKIGKNVQARENILGGGAHIEYGGINTKEGKQRYHDKIENPLRTIGWTDCGCNAGWGPGVLLDPFAGAGTVGVVAKKLSRGFIGIDIKKEYCNMAIARIKNITPSLPFKD